MIDPERYPLLSKIESPEDLRAVPESELGQAAAELRDFLIESVSRSGGHFGAGLGCIELTVALHYLYNTPFDRIVWDVGHQSYPHKILTGRKDQIETIKKLDGLAPFPKREESDFDTFGVGHAGTSVGAALGLAIAAQKEAKNRQVVAVIGDGGMTAGMAYEALNHGGHVDPDMLVILNENQMSISPNVGALTRMLARLWSGRFYTGMRERGKRVIRRGSWLWRFISRWEEHTKGMVVPSTLFEELGFNYLGPVDGHDLPSLLRVIRNLKGLQGAQLLHVITKKGKGYAPAEKDPVTYHAVSPFDPDVGMVKSAKSGGPSYTQVFGDWLCDMAGRDERLMGITPAMREGSGLVRFAKEYPDRYFDVGIAEQHSVTVAAGMACEGLKPVVAIYSTFLQRSYDQLIHDVAIQNLDVMFAIDRAGLVGPDGPTHAGSFDLSYLRCVPNMLVMAPADEDECRQMLYTGYMHIGPAAIRYPRGRGPGVDVSREMEALPIGKAEVRRRGRQVAILAFGATVPAALKAGEELGATVVNMRFVKPMDERLLGELADSHDLFVTVEDNAVAGGAGSGVNECMARLGLGVETLNLGLPDRFLDQGSRDELLEIAGLDAPSIVQAVKQRRPVLDTTDRGGIRAS